jgi:hypothetical protein
MKGWTMSSFVGLWPVAVMECKVPVGASRQEGKPTCAPSVCVCVRSLCVCVCVYVCMCMCVCLHVHGVYPCPSNEHASSPFIFGDGSK